ncbi:hypothetical protein [Streptomyces sp. NPDC085466]|uniref:hypothetical protein n=1 Tax=Streptomyces sp. NPDC085466 TaxID=3365725 RepID=UPI0037CFD6F9
MGQVLLGSSRGGRRLAVKVIRPEIAADPGFRERFRREVAAARTVGGFWTAPIVDADPGGPVPWVASDYLDAPDLEALVRDRGPLPEPELRSLATGLAEAPGRGPPGRARPPRPEAVESWSPARARV